MKKERMIELAAMLMNNPTEAELLKASIEMLEAAKTKTEQRAVSGIIHFEYKELKNMPIDAKKEFIAEGCIAHITKRPSGKGTVCYEIRYRRKGKNISVSSTDLSEAKQKFIDALSVKTHSKKSMEDIINAWIQRKSLKVCEGTVKNYRTYCRDYIFPIIGKLPISEVRLSHLDTIFARVQNKPRAREDIWGILIAVWNIAILDGLTDRNIVRAIPYIKSERKHFQALTYEQERALLEALKCPKLKKYEYWVHLLVFFGLRPCEAKDAVIGEKFLITRNRKRKHGKIEYKKIPITPIAREFMVPQTAPIKMNSLYVALRKIFPWLTIYQLRHTFASRCQEFVRQEIVEVWLGDSSQKLIANTYTHYSDDFMIEEAEKIDYRNKLFPKMFPKTE